MSSKQSSLLLFAVTAICAVLFAAALRPATTSATAAGLSAQSHTGGSALDHYVEQASEFSSRARANVYFPNPQAIFNGVQIPFHVQKFLNNGLILDLQFSSATVNTGLPATEFAVSAQWIGGEK